MKKNAVPDQDVVKLEGLEQKMNEIRDFASTKFASETDLTKNERNLTPYSLMKRLSRLEEQLPLMKSSLECITDAQKQCFMVTKRILLNHKLLEKISNSGSNLDTKEREQLLEEMEKNFVERLCTQKTSNTQK